MLTLAVARKSVYKKPPYYLLGTFLNIKLFKSKTCINSPHTKENTVCFGDTQR